MKILVTSAAGFIGSTLILRLLERGDTVIGIDNHNDGDVPDPYANVDDLVEQFDYKPSTSVDEGVAHFIDWYRQYFKL
jgi:nucleoside-diphosphate-sugar epimerase